MTRNTKQNTYIFVLLFPFVSSVRWERDGNQLEWEGGSSPIGAGAAGVGVTGALRIARVEASSAGAYTCSAVGPHGEIARRELQLIVSS